MHQRCSLTRFRRPAELFGYPSVLLQLAEVLESLAFLTLILASHTVMVRGTLARRHAFLGLVDRGKDFL